MNSGIPSPLPYFSKIASYRHFSFAAASIHLWLVSELSRSELARKVGLSRKHHWTSKDAYDTNAVMPKSNYLSVCIWYESIQSYVTFIYIADCTSVVTKSLWCHMKMGQWEWNLNENTDLIGYFAESKTFFICDICPALVQHWTLDCILLSNYSL